MEFINKFLIIIFLRRKFIIFMESNSSNSDDKNKVYIDKKAERNFRKFKEGDQIIHLYGIDNNILGIYQFAEKMDFEMFEATMPANIKINGIILIYNENVYEDFDSVICEEIGKLSKLTSPVLIANKIYAFVMK